VGKEPLEGSHCRAGREVAGREVAGSAGSSPVAEAVCARAALRAVACTREPQESRCLLQVCLHSSAALPACLTPDGADGVQHDDAVAQDHSLGLARGATGG